MRRRVLVVVPLVCCACAGEPPAGPINRALLDAATEYRVPLPLLKAIGVVETRFQPDGPTLDNGFGPMKLVERDDVNQVADAALLLGVSPETIKTDPALNIRGAAALLRKYAEEETGRTGALTWDDWSAAVARLSAIPDRDLADDHAFEVMATMHEGAYIELPSGETIDLPPDDAVGEARSALSRPYPTIRWVPANSGNYADGRGGNSIKYIVIHTTQGSYAGAISWFQSSAANVSAHYVIRSSDGQITQMVNEANTAWHAGNSTYNRQSIGIEHEGFVTNPAYYTEAMYRASARLTCAVAARYSVPIDRSHIIAHKEVPGSTHTDPGPHWNWTRYMGLVRDCITDGQSSSPPPPPQPAGCALGDGLYCGQNGVAGDARNLYRCSGGSVTLASACVTCEKRPAGEPDRCAATRCPLGDGLYCGGNGVGGLTSALYRCTAGKLAVVSNCARGCFRAPPGTADRCN